MELPIAIHKDPDTGYGVTVPDLPGCFSAGDTIDDAMKSAREAIYHHVGTLLQLGETVDLKASSIEQLATDRDYDGAVWAFVDVDLSKLSTKAERINITMPSYVLTRVDAFAESRHETRSGFLARAALALIAEENRGAPLAVRSVHDEVKAVFEQDDFESDLCDPDGRITARTAFAIDRASDRHRVKSDDFRSKLTAYAQKMERRDREEEDLPYGDEQP